MVRLAVELRGAPWRIFQLCHGPGPYPTEILVDGPADTGKSAGLAYVLYSLAKTFPGIRILVVRKTRASLAESFCVTWEKIVPEDDPCLAGASRENRHGYVWSNGAELVLGTLEKPERLYSTEWDVVLVEEAGEVTEDEWQRFLRALRNGRTPFQLLIGLTNPWQRSHWINQRFPMEAPASESWWRLKSQHKDNPSLHDGRDWTEEGKKRIGRLQLLKGVHRARLLEGRWESAEGAIWPNYQHNRHHVDPPDFIPDANAPLPKRNWQALGIRRFFASMDWGFTAPGVMGVFGITAERRLYRVAVIYRTGENIDWWAERAAEFRREFGITRIVCDPEDAGSIDVLNKRFGTLGGRDEPRFAVKADNQLGRSSKQLGGLDVVRQYLEDRSDGRPGLLFVRDALRFRDEGLVEAKQPWIDTQEIEGYVWKKDEDGKSYDEPGDCVDHGCDMIRYACVYADTIDPLSGVHALAYSPGSLGSMLRHGEIFKHGEDRAPRGPGPLLPRVRRR